MDVYSPGFLPVGPRVGSDCFTLLRATVPVEGPSSTPIVFSPGAGQYLVPSPLQA